MTTAHKFTPGQQLSTRSSADYDCIFRFEVVTRTAKFVTLRYWDTTKRVGIKVSSDGREYCLPLGNYSMSPILYADVAVEIASKEGK